MMNLVGSSKLADVELVMSGGERILAHSLLLRMSSEFYDARLSGRWSPNASRALINHPDISLQTMQTLLHFMYTGNFSVAESDIPRLISESEVLFVRGLRLAIMLSVKQWSVKTKIQVFVLLLKSGFFDTSSLLILYREIDPSTLDLCAFLDTDATAKLVLIASVDFDRLEPSDERAFELLFLLTNAVGKKFLLPFREECIAGERKWIDMAAKTTYATFRESEDHGYLFELLKEWVPSSLALNWRQDHTFMRLVQPATATRLLFEDLQFQYMLNSRSMHLNVSFMDELLRVATTRKLHSSLLPCLRDTVLHRDCILALYRVTSFTSCVSCSNVFFQVLPAAWYRHVHFLESVSLKRSLEHFVRNDFAQAARKEIMQWTRWDALLYVFQAGGSKIELKKSLSAMLVRSRQLLNPTQYHLYVIPVLDLIGDDAFTSRIYRAHVVRGEDSLIVNNLTNLRESVVETSVKLGKNQSTITMLGENWKLVFRLSEIALSFRLYKSDFLTINLFYSFNRLLLTKLERLLQGDKSFVLVSRSRGRVYTAAYCASNLAPQDCAYNFLGRYHGIWIPFSSGVRWMQVVRPNLRYMPNFSPGGFQIDGQTFDIFTMSTDDDRELSTKYTLDGSFSVDGDSQRSDTQSSGDFEIEVYFIK